MLSSISINKTRQNILLNGENHYYYPNNVALSKDISEISKELSVWSKLNNTLKEIAGVLLKSNSSKEIDLKEVKNNLKGYSSPNTDETPSTSLQNIQPEPSKNLNFKSADLIKIKTAQKNALENIHLLPNWNKGALAGYPASETYIGEPGRGEKGIPKSGNETNIGPVPRATETESERARSITQGIFKGSVAEKVDSRRVSSVTSEKYLTNNFNILIEDISSKTKVLQINNHEWTVEKLLHSISLSIGIPLVNLRYVYKNRELSPYSQQPLRNLAMRDGDIIRLKLRILGGSNNSQHISLQNTEPHNDFN